MRLLVVSGERLACPPPGDRASTSGSSSPIQYEEGIEKGKKQEAKKKATAPLKKEAGVGGTIDAVCFLSGPDAQIQPGLGFRVHSQPPLWKGLPLSIALTCSHTYMLTHPHNWEVTQSSGIQVQTEDRAGLEDPRAQHTQ